MNRTVTTAVCLVCVLANAAFGFGSRSSPRLLAHRFVFVQLNLTTDRHVDEIRDVVRRASAHGYTGMVLSAGFDGIGRRSTEYFDRLTQVKEICDENEITLVPLVFSASHASGVLAHDRNLAAAVPVRRLPLVVRGAEGEVVTDPVIGIANGGFESHSADRTAGFDWQDGPGKVSFTDTDVVKEGSVSLRFDNIAGSEGKMGRVIQKVTVRPFRCYRLSCWVKTEHLDPARHFRTAVMAEGGRVLMTCHPDIEPTQDWTEVTLVFNSLGHEEVNVYAGVWHGPSGRFWIDDMRMTEVGFLNVLRRPGTPVTVRNEETGVVYVEGEDFERIADEVLTFKDDHPGPVLSALPGGRIRDGDRLIADFYQGLALKHGSWQMGACMSEPAVYEIWGKVITDVERHIAPGAYLLSMDEIRQGGWCEACERRALSAGELLGECITRQVELIRAVNPDAEIFVWSDMLDPNHNAKNDYYLFRGDFTGSWNHVPKDIIVACWYYDRRDESLRHFDELSFRTIGCGYYDTENLAENAKGWLASLSRTGGACGIMYTTWRNQYDDLESFGDLISKR